jgi:hypothetical protein
VGDPIVIHTGSDDDDDDADEDENDGDVSEDEDLRTCIRILLQLGVIVECGISDEKDYYLVLAMMLPTLTPQMEERWNLLTQQSQPQQPCQIIFRQYLVNPKSNIFSATRHIVYQLVKSFQHVDVFWSCQEGMCFRVDIMNQHHQVMFRYNKLMTPPVIDLVVHTETSHGDSATTCDGDGDGGRGGDGAMHLVKSFEDKLADECLRHDHSSVIHVKCPTPNCKEYCNWDELAKRKSETCNQWHRHTRDQWIGSPIRKNGEEEMLSRKGTHDIIIAKNKTQQHHTITTSKTSMK